MSGKEFCFVIMSFAEDLYGVYETAIKPAVEGMDFACIRADEIDESGIIVDQIIKRLADAKFIIADLTHQNPNVFYELGISHTLANKTIVIAQSTKDVPFNIEGHRVIIYKDSMVGGAKLKKDLTKHIKTFDDWSVKPSNPVQAFLPAEAKEVVPLQQYEELDKKTEELETKLERTQGSLIKLKKDYDKNSSELKRLHDQEKELEIQKDFLRQLFPKGDLDKSLNKLMTELNDKGEVSVDVPSDGTKDEKDTKSQRITFRKINK